MCISTTVISKSFSTKNAFFIFRLKSGFLTKFYFFTTCNLHLKSMLKAFRNNDMLKKNSVVCAQCKLQNAFFVKKFIFGIFFKITKTVLPMMTTVFRNPVPQISRIFMVYMKDYWWIYNLRLMVQKTHLPDFYGHIFLN